MELGLIGGPHLLAYVNHSRPSTRSKYRDYLGDQIPNSENLDSRKGRESDDLLNAISRQSPNEAKREVDSDESSKRSSFSNGRSFEAQVPPSMGLPLDSDALQIAQIFRLSVASDSSENNNSGSDFWQLPCQELDDTILPNSDSPLPSGPLKLFFDAKDRCPSFETPAPEKRNDALRVESDALASTEDSFALVNVAESKTRDYFQRTKDLITKWDFRIDGSLSSNEPYVNRFLENMIVTKTPERRRSILKANFKCSSNPGGSHNLKFGVKYNMVGFKNARKVRNNNTIDLKVGQKKGMFEEISLFKSYENQQRPENISNATKKTFYDNVYESILCGEDSKFYPADNINKISENLCNIKFLSELQDSGKGDCRPQVSDETTTGLSVGKDKEISNFSCSLDFRDEQTGKCKLIGPSDKRIIFIQSTETLESKTIPTRIDSQFLQQDTFLKNDCCFYPYVERRNQSLHTTNRLKREDTSLHAVSFHNKTLQTSTSSTSEFSINLDRIGKSFDYLQLSDRKTDWMFEMNDAECIQDGRDAKCITFPSSSNHQAKDEFSTCKKESNYNEAGCNSEVEENQESGSDFEDFVSASEDYSSSSEAFYDMEGFYEASHTGSSKKEDCYSNKSKNSTMSAPSFCFENISFLRDTNTNCCKCHNSPATKSNSTLDLFNSNEPVIIKYFDQHTQQTDELLIYTMEYHEKLTRKNANLERTLVKLIEKSKFYVGKPIGIILNVKDIRKKHKPVPEESISSAESLKEKNFENANILTVQKNSKSDFPGANILPDFKFDGNTHCDKKIAQSFQEKNQISNMYALSCTRKLLQNEVYVQEETLRTNLNDVMDQSYSKISARSAVSYTGNKTNLRDSTIACVNDKEAVFSPLCKCNGQEGNFFPTSAIQKQDAVLRPNSHCRGNNLKRSLQVGKQLLKSVSISRKSIALALNSSEQQEVSKPKKAQFLKSSVKSSFFKTKSHPNDCISSLDSKKCSSCLNKPFNDYQEKWPKKMDASSRKQINTEEILSSDFKTYFNLYAKRGGRLKSGSVISKSNSNYWLKKSGVIRDEESQKIAEDSFAEIARKKLVLNIYDYMQYLIAVSRRMRICVADLVRQLKTADLSSSSESKKLTGSTVFFGRDVPDKSIEGHF